MIIPIPLKKVFSAEVGDKFVKKMFSATNLKQTQISFN